MSKAIAPFEPHERQLCVLLRDAVQVAPQDHAKLRIVPLPNAKSGMAYFELGDPSGTPLVCLHGLSVSGLFFEQYHEHFVANGIRGIAPCILGGIHISAAARTIDHLTTALVNLMSPRQCRPFALDG